jgi:hypothetical protein
LAPTHTLRPVKKVHGFDTVFSLFATENCEAFFPRFFPPQQGNISSGKSILARWILFSDAEFWFRELNLITGELNFPPT